jgi:hypothetical protein
VVAKNYEHLAERAKRRVEDSPQSIFLSLFFSTPPNEFFQIQAYLSLVSTVGFAIFAKLVQDIGWRAATAPRVLREACWFLRGHHPPERGQLKWFLNLAASFRRRASKPEVAESLTAKQTDKTA